MVYPWADTLHLNAVLKYPDRFDGLILNDTQCIADTPEIKENRCNAIIRIKEKGVEQYADESIKKLFAPETFTKNKNVIDCSKGDDHKYSKAITLQYPACFGRT